MPLDSVTISALAAELQEQVVGAKIDKVQQPERDTILLSLRGPAGNFRLAVCGGVGNARVHVTDSAYENPAQPPMFCMLLRKHLCGSRITALEQPERERILLFHLDAYDEFGLPVQKMLAVEMIGRGTNIILVDGENRIIDCLRRVDSDMSSLRQVLPGLLYHLPLSQTKPDFFSLSSEERRKLWAEREPALSPERWLLNSFSCLSPLICRELVFRSHGNEDQMPECMDALAESVLNGEFIPFMLLENGSPRDFSFMAISQYGAAMELERFRSFSALLDAFYTRRSQAEEMRRRTSALRKTVKNAHDRAVRKLALQTEELKKTGEREQKRRWGDLITANLYRAPKTGAGSMEVEDFYAEGCPTVSVPLNRMKSPQQNAAAYYREYNKAKTAERYLSRLTEETRTEAQYLASVLDEIDRACSEQDVLDVRRELISTGYIRSNPGKKKEKIRETAPLRFISSGGFEILVGRNNLQNDRLSLKTARKGDIWLHTQKFHGSHVLIRCDGQEPDEETMAEAASLAVLHSQAADSGKVPVDYTRAKFVKKPSGAMPGMVIYTEYATLIAAADETLAERLRG